MTEEEEQEKAERLIKAYYSTFHSAEGQLVLKDLLSKFYRVTSLSEDADPHKVLVNEGKRFVILHILSNIEIISGTPED